MAPNVDESMTWSVARSGDEEMLYRFTNLADHTAWRVLVCGEDGTDIEVPGHVGYARGWFEQSLPPGRYWLKWETTVAMLEPKPGEPARPPSRSMVFVVPPVDGSELKLCAERSDG